MILTKVRIMPTVNHHDSDKSANAKIVFSLNHSDLLPVKFEVRILPTVNNHDCMIFEKPHENKNFAGGNSP